MEATPGGQAAGGTRAAKSVDLLSAHPWQTISAGGANDSTAFQASLRLIGMPAKSKARVRNLLAPHQEPCIQRVCAQRTVQVIQLGVRISTLPHPGLAATYSR